jgi:hypothetical protein
VAYRTERMTLAQEKLAQEKKESCDARVFPRVSRI